MSLTSGTKLGPYEILTPLGAGGMGEVYRAKDTRLDRTVAIKVLPSHHSADPELKRRFDRVSSTFASFPTWRADGKKLFSKNLKDEIYAYSVTVKGSELEIGPGQRLFHASMPGIGSPYDVALDGQRFLVNMAEEEGAAPLKIMTNWPGELKK